MLVCRDHSGRNVLRDTPIGRDARFPVTSICPSPSPSSSPVLPITPTTSSSFMSWHGQLLPPPPFIRNPKKYKRPNCPNKISSYALLADDSHICISVDDVGTYCLDTAKRTWIHVGEWTLPFIGKVEYVPELKLWFGICNDDDWKLGAIDLSKILSMSTMDDDAQQPQLLGTWKELDDQAPQNSWEEMDRPHLVNLGSGGFCIARFIRAWIPNPNPMVVVSSFDSDLDVDQEGDNEYFTLLTGLDVVPCSVHDSNNIGTCSSNGGSGTDANGTNGEVEFRMIKHNSKRHVLWH